MKTNEIKSIIKFAIDNEVEAYEFYKNAALKVRDEHLKKTFEELAEEELKHEEFLKDFLISGAEEMKVSQVIDYKLAETIDKPRLTIEMEFSDAIGLAIKKEEEAMNMYKNLSEVCEDEEQKRLFLGLMNMEKLHKTRLEDIYINVAYNEVW